jgi:hypothetical protein
MQMSQQLESNHRPDSSEAVGVGDVMAVRIQFRKRRARKIPEVHASTNIGSGNHAA